MALQSSRRAIMLDHQKTKEQLIKELADLRQQITVLREDRSGTSVPVEPAEPWEVAWQSFVAHTPVFMLILDDKCCIRYANHTDSGTKRDQLIGKNLCDFCQPEDRQSVRECVRGVFETAVPGYLEGSASRLDSEEHWYASHFGPIFQDGKVVAVSVVSTNINDRKRAERSLQESEERFRMAFEEGPIGVALLGLDAGIQHVNQRFCQMLGYSEDEIIALGISGITHPDDYAKDHALGMPLLRGEIPSYTIEKRYIRKDGQIFWGQLTTSMMHDAAGKPSIVIGMIEDITERKRAEEALRKTKGELQQVASSISDYLWSATADRNGKVVYRYYSPVVEQITGRPPEFYMSGPDAWLSTIYSEDRPRLIEAAARISSGQSSYESAEYRIVWPDGTLRWLQGKTTVRQSEDGNLWLFGTVADITERKRVEEALQKAKEELEQRVEERTAELSKANAELTIFLRFAEASGEGFGMSELDGRIAYVNSTLCRLFGETTPQDVIGKQVFTYYPEEYVSKRKNEMLPALLKEGRYWHAEQTVLPHHGKPIQTSQSTFLIRDESGNPFRIAVVISDITERKLAEEARQREHRTLKHMLESSDHERQLIAYEIHDGLAQQLAGAIMQFQTYFHLKERKPKEASKAYEAAMTMLKQGHFEARRLIAGVRPPILDESGVVAAIGHLVNEQNRLKGPSIEYRSRVAFDRLAPTLENAIYRIVQEGLTNACKHSQSDGVRITLLQQKDRLRIEIRDWGTGFNTRTTKEGSYGLTGIQERAKLLGGKYRLRSVAGKGTRILVELPLLERQE
jgi:PAS domain S-box-containing protein